MRSSSIRLHKPRQKPSTKKKEEKFLYLWLEKNPAFPFSMRGFSRKVILKEQKGVITKCDYILQGSTDETVDGNHSGVFQALSQHVSQRHRSVINVKYQHSVGMEGAQKEM